MDGRFLYLRLQACKQKGKEMTGTWWRCTCGEINPPGIKYCTTARCRKKRPEIEEPKPAPEKKEEEKETKPVPVPETKPSEPKKIPWKLIASILGAISFAISFTPVPGFVVQIINYVAKILQALPG